MNFYNMEGDKEKKKAKDRAWEKFFGYEIGSLMPTYELPHTRFGFSVTISGDVARYALGLKVDSGKVRRDFHESMNKCGELYQKNVIQAFQYIIKRGILNKNLVIQTPYDFVEDSCLLRSVRCWGDAADLGLDYTKIEFLERSLISPELEEKSLAPMTYNPHNIDNPIQQLILLELWRDWAEGMCVLYSPRNR